MANDNGSYWQGYLGYPSIAYLFACGLILYDRKVAESLKDIPWKKINTEFKNDWSKTEIYVQDIAEERGIPKQALVSEIDRIATILDSLKLSLLGKKQKPPASV